MENIIHDARIIRVLYAEKVEFCLKVFPGLFEKAADDIRFVARAATWEGVLEFIKEVDFDVLLLGKLAGPEPQEQARRIRQMLPQKPIIHYKFSKTEQMLDLSLAYANGQLSQIANIEEVVQAIRTVSKGGSYFCI